MGMDVLSEDFISALVKFWSLTPSGFGAGREGALLEKVFWGKSACGAPAWWLCPIRDMSSKRHGLHDGGGALERVVTHAEPAAAMQGCEQLREPS